MKTTGIGHVSFLVKDYEKSLDFYCNKLGFINQYSLYNDDGSVWLTYLRINDQFVELFPEPNTIGQVKGQSYMHMCILVEDIEAAASELAGKGIEIWHGPSFLGNKAILPFKAEPVRCGSFAFYIDDPDGNYIEYMQYTPQSMQLICNR